MDNLEYLCKECAELYVKIRLGGASNTDKDVFDDIVANICKAEKNNSLEFLMDADHNVKCMFIKGDKTLCEYSAPFDDGLDEMVNCLFTNEYSEGYSSYDNVLEAIPRHRVSSVFSMCAYIEGREVVIRDYSGRKIEYSAYEYVLPKSSLLRLFKGNVEGKIAIEFARVVNSKKCFLYSLRFL